MVLKLVLTKQIELVTLNTTFSIALDNAFTRPTLTKFRYVTKNLPGGQLPQVLWHWPLGLLSQKKKKKKTQTDAEKNI